MKKIFTLAGLATAAIMLVSCGDTGNTQKSTENETSEAKEIEIKTFDYNVNGVHFNMIQVAEGSFSMGRTDEQSEDLADDDELPVHNVKLSSFAIGETEVTNELWAAVMGTELVAGTEKLPVVNVSWNQIQEFIPRLNEMTGTKFRMPTEAEWEFAARGGICDDLTPFSGSSSVEDVAWLWTNSGDSTFTAEDEDWNTELIDANNCHIHEVATKDPNELGLYDMSGNAWEWCSDWYGLYRAEDQTNPQGPAEGSNKVIRGGGYYAPSVYCRVANRADFAPDFAGNFIGFRLAI